MGFFPRPSLTSLTPIHDGSSDGAALKKKKRRPASFLVASEGSDYKSGSTGKDDGEPQDSPKLRSRTLLKSSRPSSIFGSLRSQHSPEDEEKMLPPAARDSPVEIDRRDARFGSGMVVLHHGEVQTTGGMFRKRKEYLVLTDTHLVRFKSQSRAAEIFPSIPASLGRSNTVRHTSMTSVGSTHDLHSIQSHSSAENHMGLLLQHVVAVYKLEDGRPYFSIEVAHLDEESGNASAMILQLNDPREADLWLTSIRCAATKARLLDPTPFPLRPVEYVARVLEQERDYDPAHFRIFKVVQRASNKSQGRSSSDDLAKLGSSVCYLVIGLHKVHLVPLPKSVHRSTSTLSEMASRSAYGITTVTAINIKPNDDSFDLSFRIPLRHTTTLTLASSASSDIAVWVRQGAEYLRPEWVEQPFAFHAPRGLEESIMPTSSDAEDHRCFDRTLIAYCASYGVDTSVIRYAISYDVDDAPQFTLLPPATPRRLDYTTLELLALLRALRYNESFGAISFRGVRLDPLHQLRDYAGNDHVPCTTRSGAPLNVKDHLNKSLLIQEIQALALKSRKLRRLDFSFCISRKPQDDEGEARDPGCEIAEALFPLCRRKLTNVDWITLNGIELGESDLDYLVDAAVERACHLRALEISRCGLTDRSLQLILNAMLSQDSTLQSIDISGNLARLSPSTFQGQIGHFGFIRKLNLSRVHRTSGPEPLVAPETMLTWRLEELHLSETPVNEQTVDSIAAYLASSMSDTLRELSLNQCGLTGKDVAVFMHSMSRKAGVARELHLHVSENRLEKNHDKLVRAVVDGLTPSHLTMKMVEYQKEDHFRELVQALRRNKTLRYLDISKASLPYDASDETCEALQLMFKDNASLEELDISGEHAHLEVAKFGIGLNHALTGLKTNSALKTLRIEYQKLGLQGANTLSSVLEENTTLREIYCENNDINLQGLTVLVNSLASNKTVLYLPRMDRDRVDSLQKVERECQIMRQDAASASQRQTSVRRTFTSVKSAKHAASAAPVQPAFSEQDLQAALRIVHEKWDRQTARLEHYLTRNANIANGVRAGHDDDDDDDDSEGPNTERPTTASSFVDIIEKAKLTTTPTVEKGDGLSAYLAEKFKLDSTEPDDQGSQQANKASKGSLLSDVLL
ncbi:MAG: hypothetical protein M1825_003801 [Sarcosagium campestre]|nr:MAG: hypothetical protein M1825_003801 [Sarcosagium campestre]